MVQSDIKTKRAFDEDAEQVAAPWSSLPVDMVEELVARLSLIDYLNVREVCKRWNSISVSASRPLMSFGELNNNMIKELMLYLRYHEQEFICISICVLTYVSRNQIKESLLDKVEHIVMRNVKQVFMQ